MKSNLIPTPYQLIGLTKLELSKLNGLLITDGVGVGKTIAAGYIIAYYSMKFDRPTYVISPMGLVDKWILEMEQKFDFEPTPVRNLEELRVSSEESKYHDFSLSPKLYIVSNTIFRRGSMPEIGIRPGLVVIDEIHNFRNSETHGFQNLFPICSNSFVRVGLSATPFNNTFEDVVSIYNLLFPDFDRITVEAIIDEIWASNKISPIITKFEKEDLKIHFAKRDISLLKTRYPDDYIHFVREKIKERSLSVVKEGDENKYPFHEIMYFRVATSSPYTFYRSESFLEHKDEIQELIQSFEDEKLSKLLNIVSDNSDERVIIFCEFRNTVKYLEKNLPKNRKIYSVTGEVILAHRLDLFEQFRKDNTGILILTSVGSEGLDMQFCSTVVNYDLHWNPMRLEQRIGRIDRVGQVKDRIKIYNLIVENSIDEKVLLKLHDKLKLVDETIFSPKDILESIDSEIDTPLDYSSSLFSSERREEERTKLLLYSQKLVEKEFEKATEHINISEQNSQINLNDYEYYSFIDKKYCNPQLIKELAISDQTLPWLDDSNLKDWSKTLSNQSIDIKETMEDYNT